MHPRSLMTGAAVAAAALLALYTTAFAQAQGPRGAQATFTLPNGQTINLGSGPVIEMIVTPCDPGIPRDECGAKMKVGNSVVSINGNSQVTTTTQNGTILAFASTGSTGSAGGGGGGGDIGSLGQNGGPNGGPPNGPPGNPNNNNPPTQPPPSGGPSPSSSSP
jgi:hypothetical protein